jgi:hypothetical protein
MPGATVALLVGLAASAGLGYQPLGPTAGVVVRSARVEGRASFDATPKRTTGHGWNASVDVLAGRTILAGIKLSAWSGGPWMKTSASLLAGVRLAPGVRLLAEATFDQVEQGTWGRGVSLDIEQGRVRLCLASRWFTQPTRRQGISGSLEVIAWRR